MEHNNVLFLNCSKESISSLVKFCVSTSACTTWCLLAFRYSGGRSCFNEEYTINTKLKKGNLTMNPRLLGNLKEWCSFFLQLPKILNTIAADRKQENVMKFSISRVSEVIAPCNMMSFFLTYLGMASPSLLHLHRQLQRKTLSNL